MGRNKIVMLVFVALLAGFFFAFDLGRFLTLEALKANRDVLRAFYEGNRTGAVVLFIVLYIVQTALSLPGAAVLSLAAGAFFGVLPGALAVNIGATTGATLAFLLSRYLFRDAVLNKFGPKLAAMNRELEERGFSYLLFLRLVPLFPFFLINLGAGLTKMPLRTFFFGTLIGIIPGSLVFCNAGAGLASIASLSEIASPRVISAFAALGLLALVPAVYQKFFSRRKDA